MAEITSDPSQQDPSLLQNVYLTPRAAEMAIGVGIVAVRPNIEIIRDVRNFVNERVGDAYTLPEDLEQHTFLIRWSGRGNKYIWQWDTIYDKVRTAKPNTPYLNSRLITQPRIDALHLGDALDDQITAGSLNLAQTQEIHIADWEEPNFAQALVRGLLFKWHGRNDKSFMTRLQGDVYDAFDRESTERFEVIKQSNGQLDEPFDATTPFVRIFRNKDDMVGELPPPPAPTKNET